MSGTYEQLMGEQNLRKLFNEVTRAIQFGNALMLSADDLRVLGRCIELELGRICERQERGE